jgi:hypothetical protein
VTNEEKSALVDKFDSAYAPIEGLIKGLPDEALRFVPPIDDAWSISDHLVHLLDGEVAVYFRLRNAVASPGAGIQPWDEEAWHGRLAYGSLDGRTCLDIARKLRAAESAFLRALIDADWSAYFLEHPERGRLGLEQLLEMYREHLAFHAPLIKRNRDAWRQAAGR